MAGNTSITITATATDNEQSNLNYTLNYGTSTSYGKTKTASKAKGQQVTFNLTSSDGISNYTTYYFRVDVSDGVPGSETVKGTPGSVRTWCNLGQWCQGYEFRYRNVTCGSCSGHGTVTSSKTCGTCSGHGTVTSSKTCGTCSGTGTVQGTCGGRATWTDGGLEMCPYCKKNTLRCGYYQCSKCGNHWDETHYCTGCGQSRPGSSFTCSRPVSKTCGTCNGHKTVSTTTTCGTCNGNKTVSTTKTCSNCSGHGTVTQSYTVNCGHSGSTGSAHYWCSAHSAFSSSNTHT